MSGPVDVETLSRPEIDYSICTLVTDRGMYDGMVASFRRAGFAEPACEFLFADNTRGNRLDAYRALDRFLALARGRHVIVCHQDVFLDFDGRDVLDRRLEELDRLDPAWAVAGNAGGIDYATYAFRITEHDGKVRHSPGLPARVKSLDENFLVVKRAARLTVSRDLDGFHFYGTDLCLVARVLGWSAWVIDFHLRHGGAGKKDPSYFATARRIVAKYGAAFRVGRVQTTTARLYLSSSRLATAFFNQRTVSYLLKKAFQLRNRLMAPPRRSEP